MKLGGIRGNSLHAPEDSYTSLVSAYVAGADLLEIGVRLTRDTRVVVAHDDSTERLTAHPGRVSEMTLNELQELDFSATFRPRDSPSFKYRRRGQQVIESLPELVDAVPAQTWMIIAMPGDEIGRVRQRELLVKTAEAIEHREIASRTLILCADKDWLRATRELVPGMRVALRDTFAPAGEVIDTLRAFEVDAFAVNLPRIISGNGSLTDFGIRMRELYRNGHSRLGAIVTSASEHSSFTADEYEMLTAHDFVWAASTGSLLEGAERLRGSWIWMSEPFRDSVVDTSKWSFGYARANRYCHVFQNDGVHIQIQPYDALAAGTPGDALEARLRSLEEGIWNASRDWPFYSGGGLGLVAGIEGDFSAEVDYEVERVGQATTLEMAVVNVDPPPHRPPWNADGTPGIPRTFRDKDTFFDPHGAPPFVGIEHDEDDGIRINWNLGVEYDSNQYGPPVGDGTILRGRLRLDRRGSFFAGYYRNDIDALDWVCVGAVRNDSLNSRVFLRCAGKRWRQEREDDPTQYWPILPNEFVFRNLLVRRFET